MRTGWQRAEFCATAAGEAALGSRRARAVGIEHGFHLSLAHLPASIAAAREISRK